MNLLVIQGGQTGVDRGAWRAAVAANVPRSGYMPKDRCDEFGMIPDAVANDLMASSYGLGARTKANVNLCHACVVIVQDEQKPYATPGTAHTLRCTRSLGKMSWTLPGDASDVAISRVIDAIRWYVKTFPNVPTRLMFAGPRQSMWAEAEERAFGIATVILYALETGR